MKGLSLRWLVIAILFVATVTGAAGDVKEVPVLVVGKRTITLDKVALLPKIKLVQTSVKEPHEGRTLDVVGLSLSSIVDFFKNDKSLSDETHVFFSCRDGYWAHFAIADLVLGRALVALKVENLKKGETLLDPYVNKKFDWRPAYLVWEKPHLVSQRIRGNSPYQITQISFGHLSNENSSLKKHCLSCHQLGGWGGTKGQSFEVLSARVRPQRFREVIEMRKGELSKNKIPMPVFMGSSQEKDEIIDSISRLKSR